MSTNKEKVEVKNGQDLSGCCIKCGSLDVFRSETVIVEHAPFWATYLRATGVLKFIYNMVAQKATLHIGLCKKHSQSGIGKRLIAYGVLLAGCMVLAVGALEENLYFQFLGVVIFIAFFMAIRSGTPVRVRDIQGEIVVLSNKMHVNI